MYLSVVMNVSKMAEPPKVHIYAISHIAKTFNQGNFLNNPKTLHSDEPCILVEFAGLSQERKYGRPCHNQISICPNVSGRSDSWEPMSSWIGRSEACLSMATPGVFAEDIVLEPRKAIKDEERRSVHPMLVSKSILLECCSLLSQLGFWTVAVGAGTGAKTTFGAAAIAASRFPIRRTLMLLDSCCVSFRLQWGVCI